MNPPSRSVELRNNIVAYVVILATAGLQIVIAYRGGSVVHRAIGMLSLTIVQAGFGIMIFMHMLQEKKALRFTLLTAILLVLLVMNALWSDSFRIVHLRPWEN